MKDKKTKERIVESYPTRQIRVSDEVWEEFERKKKESSKTWNRYIYQLINEK